MTERSAFIPGAPVGKGRPRFSKGGHAYTPAKTASYEAYVRAAWMQSWHSAPPAGVPVMVRIEAVFPIPHSYTKKRKRQILEGGVPALKKPDIDNIVKIILDALNGVAYADDKDIIEVHARKRYQGPGEEAGVTVMAKYLEAEGK